MVDLLHIIKKFRDFIRNAQNKFNQFKEIFIVMVKYVRNKIKFYISRIKYFFSQIRIKSKLFFKGLLSGFKTNSNNKVIALNITNMNTNIHNFIIKYNDFFKDFNLHIINNNNLLDNHIILNNNINKIVEYTKNNINSKFKTIINSNEFQNDLNSIFDAHNKFNNTTIGIVYINKNLKEFFKTNDKTDYQLYYNYLINTKDDYDTNYTKIKKIINIINNRESIYVKRNHNNEDLLKNISSANKEMPKSLLYL